MNESRDSGNQEYHGKNELVASKYMEVLNVLSFAGEADVSQYYEEVTLEADVLWTNSRTLCKVIHV